MNSNQPTDIYGKPYHRGLFVAVFLIGAFVMVLNQTVISTAQPAIMKSFDIGTSTVQWLTTGFSLVNGIMIPISAWLMTRFKTKPLILVALASFFGGTLVAFCANSFSMLLAGRLIQALGAGAIMPLMQTVFLTIYPPEQRGAAMGINGIVIGLAPAVGPTLSGWVVDSRTWRDLFGIMLPIVAVAFIGSIFFIKDVLPIKKTKLDLLSVITSTIGFGTLLYGFSNAGTDGWTDTWVLLEILIGVIFVIIFAWRQLKMDEPCLNLRVFKSVEFTMAALISAVATLAMTGAEIILPLYIQNLRGISAFHSGLLLLPGALMIAVIAPIAGRIFDRYGAKDMTILGMFLLSIGTVPFFFLTKDTSMAYIVIFYAFRMAGIAMALMTVTTAGMNALPMELMSHGTASNNTFRQVMSSIGVAVMTSVLTNVTKNAMPSSSVLHNTPLKYRDEAINAALSGYHATFILATGFAVVALILSLFLKSKPNRSTDIDLDKLKEAK